MIKLKHLKVGTLILENYKIKIRSGEQLLKYPYQTSTNEIFL